MERRKFLHALGAIGLAMALPKPAWPRRGAQALLLGDKETDSAVQALVDAAMRLGAEYADARYVVYEEQSMQLQKRVLTSSTDTITAGLALRAYKNGNWGHVAVDRPDLDFRAAAERACALADAMGALKRIPFSTEGRLANASVEWRTPVARDPFSVPMKEKQDFLASLTAVALKHEEIAYVVANLFNSRRTVTYANSLGGRAHQTFHITYPNCGISVFDMNTHAIDSRTTRMEPAPGGFEIAERANLRDEIEQAVLDLLQYQSSPTLKEGDYTVVIDPGHLWRVVYDTLLPMLDPYRMYGLDAADPRRRLFSASDPGTFALGPAGLTMRYDNTIATGLATAGWDDAGFPCAAIPAVAAGKLRQPPRSDELAGMYAGGECGATRSMSRLAPRFAMPNFVLDPLHGGTPVEQLIRDVKNGLYISGRGKTRLSPGKKGFQATGQIVKRIENGAVTGMVRDVAYESSTLDFWKNLVATGTAGEMLAGGEMNPIRSNPQWELPFSVVVPPVVVSSVHAYSISREKTP